MKKQKKCARCGDTETYNGWVEHEGKTYCSDYCTKPPTEEPKSTLYKLPGNP